MNSTDQIGPWEENSIYACDVQVPEPGYVDNPAMKNRTSAILFNHR